MSRFLKVVAVALLVVTGAAHARADETVGTREKTFRVKYKDGTVELYKARWSAVRHMDVREDGGPAKPFEGKFVDDRRCAWTINAYISRKVFLIAKTGKEFENNEKAKIFNADFTNQGSSFVLTNFRPENCNDAQGRRDSDYANSRTTLLNALPSIADRDFETLKSEYQQDGTVVESVS